MDTNSHRRAPLRRGRESLSACVGTGRSDWLARFSRIRRYPSLDPIFVSVTISAGKRPAHQGQGAENRARDDKLAQISVDPVGLIVLTVVLIIHVGMRSSRACAGHLPAFVSGAVGVGPRQWII